MIRVYVIIAASMGCLACGGKPPAPTPPAAPVQAPAPPVNPDENRVIDPADNPSAGQVEPEPNTAGTPQ